MLKKTLYADEKTGEVFKEENRRIKARFDKGSGYLFWNRKVYNKMFRDIDLPKELSIADIGRLYLLSRHIWANTNLLAYRGNGGIKPYSINQMQSIIGLKERQAKTFINKMIKLNIIARAEIEIGNTKQLHYYINPIYFFSSNRISLNLYLLFKDSLDQVLPLWVKQEFWKVEENKE